MPDDEDQQPAEAERPEPPTADEIMEAEDARQAHVKEKGMKNRDEVNE